MKVRMGVFSRRTVKAKLTFEEDGQRKTEEFRVVYRSLTPKLSRELAELQGAEENKRKFAEALAQIVDSIPDITEEDGETPIQINADILDSLFDWPNLHAINDAIGDDVNPPAQPSAS